MRILYAEIKGVLERVLGQSGFDEDLATINAEIFAKSTLDGYHSHGVNRFSEFVKNVDRAIIDPKAIPVETESFGSIVRFDGMKGAGPSNAQYCMEQAINLARERTMGCVTLNNTNHWMRGGNYGWQAADKGCIAICFTNTMPNMPPWGGKTNTTGNNPLIIAVPKKDGHIVLDMSLSQFSYGKIYEHRMKGKKLPYPGGFDNEGKMTDDPETIIKNRRILQTGYWKGSGLSIMLDLLATLLANGNSTAQIGEQEAETGLSQVFICIDTQQLGSEDHISKAVDDIIQHFKSSVPQQPGDTVRYPGEASFQRRASQAQQGVEVDQEIWQAILDLSQR
ncbi:MAG: 3-dehydro-L-gulonate 2-dehydrogenase [Saprospiraceae bacterium]|nr:3-dehydro-L-gulonate 2-dehydrogenase [Saprospiraceae bacterium]